MDPAPAVEFDAVTTVLGEDVVLHRLRWRVPAGRITVLMGASGSGKTTLVRHLVGLLPPDAGTVRVGDRDVFDQSDAALRELRASFAVLLGGATLYTTATFASLSTLDNVATPLRLRGQPPGPARARAWELLGALDLTGVAELRPDELAARTRRRVALAAALAAPAPLVVLDDIDTAVDAPHRAAVVAAVRSAHRRHASTMLVTTHDLALARALADEVAVLVHGRIAATGPPERVLAGIDSATEFDRRYRVLDAVGPVDPDLARRGLAGTGWTVDLRLLIYLAALLVAAALLTLLLGVAGSRGNL